MTACIRRSSLHGILDGTCKNLIDKLKMFALSLIVIALQARAGAAMAMARLRKAAAAAAAGLERHPEEVMIRGSPSPRGNNWCADWKAPARRPPRAVNRKERTKGPKASGGGETPTHSDLYDGNDHNARKPHEDTREHREKGYMTGSFTPLHVKAWGVRTGGNKLVVWGDLPPRRMTKPTPEGKAGSLARRLRRATRGSTTDITIAILPIMPTEWPHLVPLITVIAVFPTHALPFVVIVRRKLGTGRGR